MGDNEARREARRRKILQNSEKRINRLYDRKEEKQGIDTSQSEDCSVSADENKWQCKVCSNLNTAKREICLLCATPADGRIITKENNPSEFTTSKSEEETDITSNETSFSSPATPTGSVRQRRGQNTVKLQRPDVIPQEREEEEETSEEQVVQKPPTYSQSQQFEMFRILGCLLLALLSRLVLNLNSGYGLFYFQSIFLSFAIFEVGLHLYKNQFLQDVAIHQKGNMMSTVLMLSGIQPHLITTYNKIMSYVKAVTEDFFLFIFLFFAFGLFVT